MLKKMMALAVLLVIGIYYVVNTSTVPHQLTKLAVSNDDIRDTEVSVAKESNSKPPKPPTINHEQPLTEHGQVSPSKEVYENFREWLVAFQTDDQNPALLEQGIEAAKQRRLLLEKDIRNNPQQALNTALSFSEYASLPRVIQVLVEQPISITADLDILPNENPQSGSLLGTNTTALSYEDEGKRFYHEVSLFGRRESLQSKKSLSVQGIRLGDVAAIEDSAFRELTKADLEWAKANLPIGNPDVKKDFFTDAEIVTPIAALSKGKIYYFSSSENLSALNAAMTQLEQQSGPKPHLIQQLSLTASGSSSVANKQSLQARLEQSRIQASTWTETSKKVFFIRVDFSDKVGESVSEAALTSVLNGAVAYQITDFSYGKTTVEGLKSGSQIVVSPQVVRVPQVSTYYTNLDAGGSVKGSLQLYTDTINAFKALGTGVDLDGFDIVGIHFTDIDVGYLGLASLGGSKHWIHNTTAPHVMVHEFGHNYGLSHANYWDTSGTSVVGAGKEVGYGDIYDNMGYGKGDFHIQAKALLNWLPETEWSDVRASGSYRVYRFDQGVNNQNKKALRLQKGSDEYYWLGYRKDFTNNNVLQKGAYIIWQRPGARNSVLIDTTPGSSGGKNDAGIVLGRTYSDQVADIHITPTAVGGEGSDAWIDIQVHLGDFPQNQNPNVAIQVPSVANAREPISFSAIASDPDGDVLSYTWDFGDGVVHDNASSLTQTWVAGGTYNVKLTVSDMKGGVATDTVNIAVTDPATTWSNRGLANENNDFVDIATDGNLAIAITNFAVYGSTDGAAWEKWDARRTVGTGLGSNLYLYAVIHDGSQWVAVGSDYNFSKSKWEGVIYTSSNGRNWVMRYFGGSKLRGIAASDSILVAVGDNGGAVRSTDSGVTWAPVETNISTRLINIAYGNSTFIAVGNQYIRGDVSAVATSKDGLTWVDQTSQSGEAAARGYRSLEYLKDKFIGAGYNSKLGYLENDGGIAFRSTRLNREVTHALMYGEGVYYAAGNDQGDSSKDIDLISLDGKSWFVVPNTPSIADRTAGVFFKNTFITVGHGGSIRQSDVLASPVTDADFDGQDDSDEANVPDLTGSTTGDGNGDGALDSSQKHVTSLKANDNEHWFTFVNSENGTQSEFITAAAPVTTPTDHQLNLGTVQYNIASTLGGTVTIEVYVNQNRDIADYLLLSSDGKWYMQSAIVTHDGNKTKLVFSVTEGGAFDRDGVADGVLQLAIGGVMVKTGFDIYPSAYLFGNTDLNTQTTSKQFTVKNTGSRSLLFTNTTLVGNDAMEFVVTSENCTNTTLSVGATCDISVSFRPNSIGSKSALLSIESDDPDNPVTSIFLRNHEADEEESARRLPPVLHSLAIKTMSGQEVKRMTTNTEYTLSWSILGYHDDYVSMAAIFDCRGIADNTTCGDNYTGSKFLATGSVEDDGVPLKGIWKNGEIESKIFNFSYTFTTPDLATDAPVVIRIYRNNNDDLQAENSSLSLIIPGNQADEYYDTTGRRVKNMISLP